MTRTFRQMFDEARSRLDWWVEQAKLDYTVGIVALMRKHDVSRAELARRLDVSPAYVTKVLKADANLTIESMVKMARALDGTVRIQVTPHEAENSWVGTWAEAKTTTNSAAVIWQAQEHRKSA